MSVDPGDPLFGLPRIAEDEKVIDLLEFATEWWHFGFDWHKIMRDALLTDNINADFDKSYVRLGEVAQIVPSGQCCTTATVGVSISKRDFDIDYAYLLSLRNCAAKYNARLETDDAGTVLYAVFDLSPCIECAGVIMVAMKDERLPF